MGKTVGSSMNPFGPEPVFRSKGKGYGAELAQTIAVSPRRWLMVLLFSTMYLMVSWNSYILLAHETSVIKLFHTSTREIRYVGHSVISWLAEAY